MVVVCSVASAVSCGQSPSSMKMRSDRGAGAGGSHRRRRFASTMNVCQAPGSTCDGKEQLPTLQHQARRPRHTSTNGTSIAPRAPGETLSPASHSPRSRPKRCASSTLRDRSTRRRSRAVPRHLRRRRPEGAGVRRRSWQRAAGQCVAKPVLESCGPPGQSCTPPHPRHSTHRDLTVSRSRCQPENRSPRGPDTPRCRSCSTATATSSRATRRPRWRTSISSSRMLR